MRADDEVGLQAERTLLAWRRAGLGFAVAGTTLLRALLVSDAAVLLVVGATGLLASGGVVFLVAMRPTTTDGSSRSRAAMWGLSRAVMTLALTAAAVVTWQQSGP